MEFHVPGSPPVVSGVLEAVLARGVRLARPGEFTERAYLSGRIDLAQAEAVMKLVHAAGEAEGRLAIGELAGALSTRTDALAERLTETLARVEMSLDFSEDDVPAAGADEVTRAIEEAARDVEELRRTSGANVAFSERPRAAVIGRANAGKSSLFNRLLDREAAIVTAVAGTTRDTLEEEIDIAGAKALLVDTAGPRGNSKLEAQNSKAEPDPDEEAIRRAHMERERADLLLLVVDASEPLTPVDLDLLDCVSSNPKSKIAPAEASTFAKASVDRSAKAGQNPKSRAAPSAILVLNKTDLRACDETVRTVRSRGLAVSVSCLTGEGIDRLRSELHEALSHRGVARPGQRFLLNLRQLDALRLAAEALERARGASGLELVADDLRAAINHLRSLTHPLDEDELLDRIFSRFCIGK